MRLFISDWFTNQSHPGTSLLGKYFHRYFLLEFNFFQSWARGNCLYFSVNMSMGVYCLSMLTCYCINLTSFVPHDDVMWNYFCAVSINSLPPKSCPIQPLDSSFPIPIIHPFVKVERTQSKFYMAGFSPLPYRHLKPLTLRHEQNTHTLHPTHTHNPHTISHAPHLTLHTLLLLTHIAILPPLSVCHHCVKRQ